MIPPKMRIIISFLLNICLLVQSIPLKATETSINCLPGTPECGTNTILSCAHELYPEQYEDFQGCFNYMQNLHGGEEFALGFCSHYAQIPMEVLSKCAGLNQIQEGKAGSNNASKELSFPAEKVKIELYMEILCPDCYHFIANQIRPHTKELRQIADIEIIPFGNAKFYENEDGNYVFVCQHGPNECYGNMILACAKKHLPNRDAFLDFAICFNNVAKTAEMRKHPQLIPYTKLCAPHHYNELLQCANSLEGEQLLHIQGEKTNALQPPHTEVPWLQFDHIHTPDMQDDAVNNLLKYTCKKYKGKRPSFC